MSRASRPAVRSEYHAALGSYLRTLRNERGVKPAAMAAEYGVSDALISKAERGRRGLSALSLSVYCDALNVDLLDMLADVAAKYRQEQEPLRLLDFSGVPYFVRQLDGLALFAEIPEPYLPLGLVRPVEIGRERR